MKWIVTAALILFCPELFAQHARTNLTLPQIRQLCNTALAELNSPAKTNAQKLKMIDDTLITANANLDPILMQINATEFDNSRSDLAKTYRAKEFLEATQGFVLNRNDKFTVESCAIVRYHVRNVADGAADMASVLTTIDSLCK